MYNIIAILQDNIIHVDCKLQYIVNMAITCVYYTRVRTLVPVISHSYCIAIQKLFMATLRVIVKRQYIYNMYHTGSACVPTRVHSVRTRGVHVCTRVLECGDMYVCK